MNFPPKNFPVSGFCLSRVANLYFAWFSNCPIINEMTLTGS